MDMTKTPSAYFTTPSLFHLLRLVAATADLYNIQWVTVSLLCKQAHTDTMHACTCAYNHKCLTFSPIPPSLLSYLQYNPRWTANRIKANQWKASTARVAGTNKHTHMTFHIKDMQNVSYVAQKTRFFKTGLPYAFIRVHRAVGTWSIVFPCDHAG